MQENKTRVQKHKRLHLKTPFSSNEEPPNKRKKSTVGRKGQSTSVTNYNSTIDFDMLCDRKVEFLQSGSQVDIISVELAEHSKYFDRLFRYHDANDIIKLPEFLNKPFQNILEFIRFGRTAINSDNIYSIFLAADFLLLPKLKSKCLDYIKEKVDDMSHAIRLWISTKEISNVELKIIALDKILEHFENAWKSEEFLHLEFEDVKLILSDDGLNCASELSVLHAIFRWIGFDEKRKEYLPDLILSIRIGLLTENERKSIESWDCVKSDPCMSSILEFWPKFLSETVGDPSLREYQNKVMLPRIPHEIVLVFGGWCNEQGPRQIVQAYNPMSNKWSSWTANSNKNSQKIGAIPKRVYAGCVVVGTKVYLIGGFDGHSALKSTLYYDFESPECGWKEVSCMYDKRYYVGVVHIEGTIYAVGGHNGEERGRLNSGEKYNIAENQWYSISPMNKVRSDASAAELQGKVYVCGGFEGRRYHDSAEYYDPVSNHWTMISRMNSPRGGVTLVKHSNYLYAIGGNDGINRLRNIERYCPDTGEWESVGMMSQQKSNLSAAVVNDDIYIIGGWSDEQHLGILNTVEKFNTTAKSCTQIAPLNFPASATCACVLKGRRHTQQYIVQNEGDVVDSMKQLERSHPTQNSPLIVVVRNEGHWTNEEQII